MSSIVRKFVVLSFTVPALAMISFAVAETTDAPRGQWSGKSQVDGERSSAKTVLSLGAPATDDAMLRIEGESTCTLKQGTYGADASGGWTLSFKQPMGGAACERLSKGTFVLRAGATPKQLDFAVKYTGADGRETQRRGMLNRYP